MKPRLELLQNSHELKDLAQSSAISFTLQGDSWRDNLQFAEGRLLLGGTPQFTLSASEDVWAEFLNPNPRPGWQSIVHLTRSGAVALTGDVVEFHRHIHIVRIVIEVLRGSTRQDFVPQRQLRARGEYHRVGSAVGTADIHVERCGTGQPVVALATAGSSITQWHGLMTESDITDRFELITIDLPWHGSSSPTFGTAVGKWSLTPESYSRFIVDATRSIGLKCPSLLGVSMAGAAVVHAVATYPDHFSGAVACQAGPRVRHRSAPQLESTDIDQSLFVPEWTHGLMNPDSPAEFRKRVWWGYSSGGHGLYAADIDSYQQWDFETVSAQLTPNSPHIAVLSGSYDTSVMPEASRALADSIPNSSFCEMPELGHFPHAENPSRFANYLEPALERVIAHRQNG